MATALRLVATLGAVLLVCGAAPAQPATAPPPHPALDELVKEYQRLGLPLPPQNAELVRINWYAFSEPQEKPPEAPYLLAFRVPPAVPGGRPRYLEVSEFGGDFWERRYVEPTAVEPAPPTPEALRQVLDHTSSYYLTLAIMCRVRGWDRLAATAYSLARDKLVEEDWTASMILHLREIAWGIWKDHITGRATDRKECLRRLKSLAAEEKSLRTPENEWLLRSLEQTVAPRKSKPGSVEALIDDLTDYWVDPDDSSNRAGREAYWKLVELGFDAVPALIDHLNDDRLSRSYSEGFNNFFPFILTVGHLCSRLLFDLSARTIGGGYWELRGDRLDPAEARKWFEQARKVGEERWLIEHAIPKDGGKTITNQRGRPEPLIVRVIGAKYPGRLPVIYREMLKQPVAFWLNDYVKEIVASKLPREQKTTLLVEGATHDDLGHRLLALEGLSAFDQPLFRKHTLLTLKYVQAKQDANQEWRIGTVFASLVLRADDRACWDALAKVARKADFENRMYVIFLLDLEFPPGDPHLTRREHIRFLMQFLDDRTAGRYALVGDDEGDVVEVRDYAATQLAGLLGIPVRRRVDLIVLYEPKMGALSRFLLRVMVRQLAERELAGKP